MNEYMEKLDSTSAEDLESRSPHKHKHKPLYIKLQEDFDRQERIEQEKRVSHKSQSIVY